MATLTVMDIQKLLGVSRPTVDKWIKSGGLPTIRIGKFIRVSEEDLQSWLEANKKVGG